MQAIPLTPGQVLDELLLVGAAEIETAGIGAGRNLELADLQDVLFIRDFLPHRVSTIQFVATLVNIGQIHGLAEFDAAAVGLFLTDQHAQEGSLAGAVATDDSDYAALGHGETQVIDQGLVTKALAEVFDFNDLVTQAWSGWNVQLLGFVAFLELLRVQFLEASNTSLALGLATLGIGANPFQL